MIDTTHERATRQTKIVATLGPASNSREKIEALVEAGANVFRLNFSHGSHEDIRALVDHIRAIEAERQKPIAILADLQGPKLRIGKFAQGSVKLEEGQTFRFDSSDAPGDDKRVQLPHSDILEMLGVGDAIFLDDGKVRVEVQDKGSDDDGPYIEGIVRAGTKLSDNKGFNLPGLLVPVPALTEKDKKDLVAALDMGVDWVAQSFVQRPEDVKELRALVDGRAAIMVKLEKPSALECLDELIDLADGMMLARGDLGVEIPPQDVPPAQKHVVRAVHMAGKPVIVATQMLESMIDSPRPTRAEASDVATAVYDGADAVMLSAETAAGSYPVKAVQIMARICRSTEQDDLYAQMLDLIRDDINAGEAADASNAITTSAYYVAMDIGAAAIVTYTKSGSTSLRAAKQRPPIPIVCLTPHEAAARRLVLSYGVFPVVTPEEETDFTGPARHAAKILKDLGYAGSGESFVMTAGVPFGVVGTTNILRIAEVE